jgi:hypothetical protein
MIVEHIKLQNIILPGLDFPAPIEIYVRLTDRVSPIYAQRSIRYIPGGRSSFDTYFNSISIGTLKRITTIDKLYLRLEGEGRFILRVGAHRLGHYHRWLKEEEINLPQTEPLALPWEGLEDGMLYFTLDALEDGELTGGCFLTSNTPSQEVKLGVVITHFNRKAYVVPAIARIREKLLTRPEIAGKIELIVVDNSRNLTETEAAGATLIPNPNYGGSGGFTRGLLYLMDHGFTHCLFMDDDATCEIDSLARVYTLQRFARKQNLAISGALLREFEPSKFIEKGASFHDGIAHPLHHGRDVRDVHSLLEIEQLRQRSDYGAWWLFCFKISEADYFPFPFFVRGDDIFFGILNKFSIETVNGISCWGEDFQLKENPTTRYLGMRATLAVMLMQGRVGRMRTLRLLLSWFLSSLFSYNYGSAEAILMAIRDVAKGPSFWKDNMDTTKVRLALAPFNAEEKMQPVCLTDYRLSFRGLEESRWRRWLRILTLNGFLLPSMLLRDSIVYEEKSFRAVYRRIFRYRKVLYYSEATGLGYIAVYNRKRFFVVLRAFVWAARDYLSRLPDLQRTYQVAMPSMTSEVFWREVYQKEAD